MTVEELIETLKKFPSDARVEIADEGEGISTFYVEVYQYEVDEHMAKYRNDKNLKVGDPIVCFVM